MLSTINALRPYQRHIDLSVVIPCHNVGDKIGHLVELLLEGTRPLQIEVLLVEDSSSDSSSNSGSDSDSNSGSSSDASNGTASTASTASRESSMTSSSTVSSATSLTWREVTRLANAHHNVFAFPTSVPGGGAGRARNSAIPLLEGRYTFFMDGDDGLNVANLVAAVRHMR